MQPEHIFLNCAGFEVHVTCWGDVSKPAVVMWHGLTRTGRDFDELAAQLASDFFVVCPDTIGRGLSQWSQNPEQDYTLFRYMDIAKALLSELTISACFWIGTSMGGLLGMLLASEENTPIKGLLVNDVGPELPLSAMQRIGSYIAVQPAFKTIIELEAWMRRVYLSFGNNSDAFWRRMAITSSRRLANGEVTLHYDPALIKGFSIPEPDAPPATLWEQWQAIRCPIAIVRGADSDLLLEEVMTKMCQLQPEAISFTVPDTGHAPTLVTDEQQQWVVSWLKGRC